MAARMDPYGVVGTMVGERYSVDYFVGVGRFSVVYRGTQLDTLCPVALKFLKVRHDLEKSARGIILERLVEARSVLGDVARHCATFCEIKDTEALVTADGRWVPFVVQSWLEGVPLESELVNDALHGQRWRTLGEAIDLLAPVADALSYAHARGIIHGGLAPRSLYLRDGSPEWTVVDVLDLGVAAVLAGAQADVHAFAEDGDPLLCFAPAYGAPEQFDAGHGEIGPATDVFALALIVAELLIGRAPLGEGDDAQLEAASTDPADRPTPRALGLDLGPYVEAVFARALAVDPRRRYASIAGFWEALRAAHRVMVPNGRAPVSSRAPTSAHARHSRPTPADAADQETPQTMRPPSMPAIPARPSGFPASMPPLPRRTPAPRPLPASMPPLPRTTPPRPDGGAGSAAPVPPSVPPPPFALDVPEEVLELAGLRRVGRARALGIAAGLGACLGVAGLAYHALGRGGEPAAREPSARPDTLGAGARSTRPACPTGMAEVPGGRFFMGSDDDLATEKPSHPVTVSPYCIDATEVTVERFKACSDEGRCKAAPTGNAWKTLSKRDRGVLDPICNMKDPAARATHPVNCVDWETASAFCAASGSRLPTEAEWELAARGPDGRRYPWGDDEPSAKLVNACGKECTAWTRARGLEQASMYRETDGFPTTAPVGSFPAGDSPYGVHDLIGNVWEWTADAYGDYPGTLQVDPRGPDAPNGDRVIRGGGWNGDSKAAARATARKHGAPDLRSHAVGFRCARSIAAP